MRQVLQSLRDGRTEVTDVPAPRAGASQLLVRTSRSLVSAGTERMLVEFGRSGWIGKARQQPERVRQVLQKAQTDGIIPTLEAVLKKLDQPLALGYCNVGTVIETGCGVSGFSVGDRVASNGKHAEIVSVPVNLSARIPDGLDDDSAAFTVLAAIALQGVRLVAPTLGESVVVTGLGLIGLIAVQLLRANGCRVLGLDYDPERLVLARRFGAETVDLSVQESPVQAAERFSRGRGVDAVLVTASTSSNAPVRDAARMCRKRGRIVLVGVAGLDLDRSDFYERELTFQVSCSYGPGRYDPAYEEGGHDYPVGYVRWTEQRNFEAVLDLMAAGTLDVKPLISHHITITEAARAYDIVSGGEPSLGILLEYPPEEGAESAPLARTVALRPAATTAAGRAAISFIGAGNYATSVLIPAFAKTGARLVSVASAGGVSGVHSGRKFGFERTTTDTDTLLGDPAINAVVIATRHDSHPRLVLDALRSGKHVFVEKPLALAARDVDAIEAALSEASNGPLLMVGFNRRFSPHAVRANALLGAVDGPMSLVMTVNAGAIPKEHWVQDREAGGGRIVGEACHFIDFLRFLVGAPIVRHWVMPMRSASGDTATISLEFADGSIGAIHYIAIGSKAFPKERLEVFRGGRVLQLDNFRRLRGYGWPKFRSMALWRQDKGQNACAAAFVKAVEQGGPPPIPLNELFEVSRLSIAAAEATDP